jgi:hypothetical protein
VTRFQCNRRDDGLAAPVALLCACLILASLLATVGGSAAAAPSGSTPSAESFETSPAVIDGLAVTNSARPRLLPARLKAVALGLATIFLTGAAVHRAVRAPRTRRAHLVLDDVGDRWRALLVGAPPALFSL